MAFNRRPKRVRVRRTPPPTLTTEQINRIIATANADPRLHLTGIVVQILVETGVRARELQALSATNIDVEMGVSRPDLTFRLGRDHGSRNRKVETNHHCRPVSGD